MTVAAEYKYDGQRAQVHRDDGDAGDAGGAGGAGGGAISIFSRKNDDMTSKYPDVILAVQVCALLVRAWYTTAVIHY